MSIASSPSQSPVRQRCARCGLSLENASLLLVCEHNLCLHCAAQLLEKGPSSAARRQHVVACKVCHAVTEVDYPAASYLENLLSPSTTRLPCGSDGSTHVAAVSACLDSPAARTVSHASDDGSFAVLTTVSEGPRQKAPLSAGSEKLTTSGKSGKDAVDSGKRPEVFCWSSSIAADSKPEVKPVAETSLGQKCGQCEDKAASLFCKQCEEVFCSNCASTVHRLGRMARHNVQQLEPKRTCPSTSGQKLRPLNRTFHACPYHPEEPLNYFCIECQSECICAECCLHGKHRGHEVQCVLEAVSGIDKNVEALGAALCAQEDSLKSMVTQIQERRLELARALAEGQQDMRMALQKAHTAVKQEEGRWLQEAQDAENVDMSTLFQQAEGEIGELQRQLSMSFQSGDPMHTLVWFAKLKEALATPAASSTGDALQRIRSRQSHFSEKCLALQQAAERLALVEPQLSPEKAMPPLLRSCSEREKARSARIQR